MCRSRAACDSEPVRPMRSSSAILPGPTACLRPKSTRKRMAGIGMRCRQVGRGAWVALVAAVLPRYIQMNITIGAARTSSVRTVILEHGKMRKQILTTAAILTGCAAATGAAAVDIGADTRVGGQIFFDVSHISLQNENSSGAKIDAAPTGTGFDVKRFYLSIDHRVNDVWSADLTTDAQFSTASTATVTTSTGNTTVLTNQNSSGGVSEVFIKKLYLEGKFDRAFVVHIGSYDMPWDRFVESLYGYRYIEKTTTDRLGFSNTTDWGLNASGSLGDGDLVTYAASVVNGAGYKNPTRTKDVDFEGRIGVKPADWLTLGAAFYSGHLAQINASNENFPSNTATRLDFVAGVNYAGFRVGAEYFGAKNYKTVKDAASAAFGTSAIVTASGAVPVSDKADGFSGWASYAFDAQWSVFGRYDEAKLSKDVAPDLKDKYLNIGLAYKPIKALDFALVYKNEKVNNGSTSISGADANGSYAIGGANGTRNGTFDELGLYAQWVF